MTLSRSTGLKRTAFKRPERKEADAVAKLRKRKCSVKSCRREFMPAKPFETWCSPDCGTVLAMAKVAKASAAKARADRVETKRKLEKFKRKADWIAEAQRAFNAFIRERDRDQPCICCGRTSTAVDGLGAHGWDCGHYRSVGSAPFHRFNEDNAHRQLVYCNRDRAGNAVAYRTGLIARIGLARVEALEADNEPRHYSTEDIKAIRDLYRAKLKALKASRP